MLDPGAAILRLLLAALPFLAAFLFGRAQIGGLGLPVSLRKAARVGATCCALGLLALLELQYISQTLRPGINNYAEQPILVASVLSGPAHVHDARLLRDPPYQVNPYMPLTYLVYSLFQSDGSMSLKVARQFNLVALNVALVALVLVARKLAQSSLIGLLAGIVFLCWGATLDLGTHLRPDTLAMPWLCALIWLRMREGSGARVWIAATLCLGLASFFKFTLWSTPVAFFIGDLLKARKRSLLCWGLVGAALACALGAWHVYTQGGFYEHVVKVQKNLPFRPWFERELLEAKTGNGGPLTPSGVLFCGVAAYCSWLLARNRELRGQFKLAGEALIFFATALGVAVFLMRKWGAGNYYLEFGMAASLVAAVAAALAADRRLALNKRAALALCLMLGIAMVLPTAFRNRLTVGEMFDEYARLAENDKLEPHPRLAQQLSGKLVLADSASQVLVNRHGGKIFVNDPACFSIEFTVGTFDEAHAKKVRAELASKVDYVVLNQPIEWWFGDLMRQRGGYDPDHIVFVFFEQTVRATFGKPVMIEPAVGGAQVPFFLYSRLKK